MKDMHEMMAMFLMRMIGMNGATEKLINAILDTDSSVTLEQRTAVLAILNGRTTNQRAVSVRQLMEKSQPIGEFPATSSTSQKKYFRRHEAAKHIACSVRQIDLLKHNGDLPFHRLGRRLIVFQREDLEALMRKSRVSLEDGEAV